MRTILIFAAVLIGLGTLMARVADSMSPSVAPKAAVAAAKSAAPANASRSATIAKDAYGHFQAQARVDGRDIGFMVDTGATVIALTESDAARVGIRPFKADYTRKVTTANGTAMAAPARLASIDIGGVVVRDVDALVMPDSVLSQNLLGMAFLSRLKRFEYSNGRLVLEQ
jgi:aspartyl protease family protein